jgi:site-specific DNA-adenine methylase
MSIGYWGSKKRFAQDIADELCAHSGRGVLYEPFCGMASVGMEVLRRGCFRNVAFSDSNENIVEYWKGIAAGWLPSTKPLTHEQWARLRRARSPSARRSFYGYDLGFGGIFLAGRAPNASMNREGHLTRVRQRLREAEELLRGGGWTLRHERFEQLRPVPRSVIYCDPPYLVTTTDGGSCNPYQHFTAEQTAVLWDCMRRWLRNRCIVFLSAARRPRPPPDLRLTSVREWSLMSNIQSAKRGSGHKRREVLLRVELVR